MNLLGAVHKRVWRPQLRGFIQFKFTVSLINKKYYMILKQYKNKCN